MSAFVYILRCRDGENYVGCTGDLSRRLAEHREGLSRWTAPRRPLELVYFERFETPAQGRRREQSLRNGRTRRKKIEQMIVQFPPALLAPFA